MDVLQVIAEPKRRKILRLIWDEELAASDIADNFEVTFGAVSQHLAVLRKAEFVTMRRDGNRRLYRADKKALGPFVAILEDMWRTKLRDLAAAIEKDEDLNG